MLNNKEIIEQLNQKLKILTTYEEFETFEKEIDSYMLGLNLHGKRRKSIAYAFSHLYNATDIINNPYEGKEEYRNRVTYLYESGNIGESYVKNLWKVLEVR
jgi:hypothetical protein